MMRKFIPESNIELINFSELFQKISVDFLNKVYDYNLIIDNKLNINQKDTERLLYHTVIYSICEEIISSSRKCKKIILVPDKLDMTNDIWAFCEYNKFVKKLTTVLNIITKNLPIIIFFLEKPVDNEIFSSKLIRDEGEIKDLLGFLEIFVERSENKKLSFEKIKKFAKNKKLDFLSDVYFNNLRTKQLIF